MLPPPATEEYHAVGDGTFPCPAHAFSHAHRDAGRQCSRSPAHPGDQLDAPVTPVDTVEVEVSGKTYTTLDVPPPRRRVAPHLAVLGVAGNTVFNGHNTLHGEVFRYLHKLEPGDAIEVIGQDGMT
jgi:hypothetical protein